MALWILIVNGRVISCQTARPLTKNEFGSQIEIARRQAFDIAIERKLGTSIELPKDDDEPSEWRCFSDVGDRQEIPETDEKSYDAMINSEVVLPHHDQQSHAVV